MDEILSIKILALLIPFFYTSCAEDSNLNIKNTKTEIKVKEDTGTIYLSYTVKSSDFSWGQTMSGDTINTTVNYTNDSDSPVILTRITTGDGGCYIDVQGKSFKPELIEPNTSFKFNIRQLTNGRNGFIKRTICLKFESGDTNSVNAKKCFQYFGFVK